MDPKKILIRLTGVTSLLVLANCSSGPLTKSQSSLEHTPETVLFLESMKVHRFSLENGLKLLVLEDSRSPTFAYQTWFRVGSRDETPGLTGLAHLFEHMMFKGTKKYPDGQFDKLLEEAGAEGKNAFTSRDYTAYIQELPKSQLPLIIDIESDRMSHLVVDEKSFSTEREVVHNERRFRNENSPDGLMYQEIFGLAFEKHSYRWPIIGMEEDLNAMTAQDARDFYQAHYAPNFATIVVVGDVIAQDVYHQIKRAYGSIPRSDRPQTRPPIEPPQTSMKRKTLKLNVQAEKLMVAYRVPELSHPDVPALSLLRAILTDGKSGRLKRALIHTGVASDADGYDLDDQDPSLMIFFANLQQGRSAVEAETIMLKELEKMQKSLVAEKELQRALSQIKFQFYLGLGDAKAKARTLGHYESIFGDFRLVERILAQMEKVTPADIQRVAQTYFKPDLRNVVLGVGK